MTKISISKRVFWENLGVTSNFCTAVYMSPHLYQQLLSMGMYACGTCKPSRKAFPKRLAKKKLPKGKDCQRGFHKFFCRREMTACAWFDRRYVHFLSTLHPPVCSDGFLPVVSRRDGREEVDVPCPPLLTDYITFMRGVDRGDQLIQLYNVGRKSYKPWRRMFYMIEVCVLNSYILEGCVDARHQVTGKKKRDMLAYKKELGVQLVEGFHGRKAMGRPVSAGGAERLNKALEHIPVSTSTKNDCEVCCARGKRRKLERSTYRHRTSIKCQHCQVHLCVLKDRNCFSVYHSASDYSA